MKRSGWGRFPRVETIESYFESSRDLSAKIGRRNRCIAFARGRSYGDSALSEHVIHTRLFDKALHFDERDGLLTCESGITLAEIIDAFLPRGWFLEVTPGTKFASVGGAIASDVHGKNHHLKGCFSESILSLNLMLPSGEVVQCSRTENPDLFHATCGGMGLTGIILEATLRLQRVSGSLIAERIVRCRNLDEVLEKFERYRWASYSVAWIDCLAKGREKGRSLLMLGEHTARGKNPIRRSEPTLSIPFPTPSLMLNRYSVSLFNYWYFARNVPRSEERIVHLDTFFYPLDRIEHWNRLYGSKGFIQYQFVLPKEGGREGLQNILDLTSSAGLGSFLAVLKLLGPENENLLSFPLEGYTLALDFKIQKVLFPFLEKLDRIVMDYGGRLYLSKDARMQQHVFRKGYDKLDGFMQIREAYGMNRKFHSLQSKRLGI